MQQALAGTGPDADILALLQGAAVERAFALLVERYAAKVYRLCYAMLRDPALAQDVAQESWIRVWRALAGYDPHTAALRTWIYAITRNRCLSAIEGRREWLALDSAEAVEAETERQALAGDPPDTDEGARVLRELVDLLPERYRRTLTLYYYEDRSVGEVAE